MPYFILLISILFVLCLMSVHFGTQASPIRLFVYLYVVKLTKVHFDIHNYYLQN